MVKAIPCCGFALSEAQLVFWLTIVQSGSLELHFLEAEGKLSTQLHNVSVKFFAPNDLIGPRQEGVLCRSCVLETQRR